MIEFYTEITVTHILHFTEGRKILEFLVRMENAYVSTQKSVFLVAISAALPALSLPLYALMIATFASVALIYYRNFATHSLYQRPH